MSVGTVSSSTSSCQIRSTPRSSSTARADSPSERGTVTRSAMSSRRASAPISSRATTWVPVRVGPSEEPSSVTESVPTASRAAAMERASGSSSDCAASWTALA